MAVFDNDLAKLRRKEIVRLLSRYDDRGVVDLMQATTQLAYVRQLMASGFAELQNKQAQGLDIIEARRMEFRIAAEVMITLGVDPDIGEVGYCAYPNCKCIVQTSTSKPEPECKLGLPRERIPDDDAAVITNFLLSDEIAGRIAVELQAQNRFTTIDGMRAVVEAAIKSARATRGHHA